MTMNKILFNGDSKIELQKVQDNSVDFMATDPPYGYSFMVNRGIRYYLIGRYGKKVLGS